MTRRRCGSALLVGAGLLLSACSSGPHYSTVPAPRVPLTLDRGLSAPLVVGLVVTTSSASGEGDQDLPLAAGARVAVERLRRGHDTTLVVEDDHGTAAGSEQAVRSLLDRHVTGIVYASQGSHLDAGLRLAAAAHTAVLLPYATDPPPDASTARLTGPDRQQILTVLRTAAAARSVTHPLVVATAPVPGLETVVPGSSVTVVPDGADLADRVADLTTKGTSGPSPINGVIVWAPGRAEGDIVAGVQRAGGASPLPVLLSPDALTPAFATRLHDLGGTGGATTAGTFVTAGIPQPDDGTSPGGAAFLAALRVVAADSTVSGLESTQSFSADGAADADSRSHDAVLALAEAAASAHSGAPAAVATALSTLSVPTDDGLAGPALTFTAPAAVADRDVAVLQATPQGSGRRTGIVEPAPYLSWFSLPAAS